MMNSQMPPKSKPPTVVPSSIQRQIDENLRRIYAANPQEGIPTSLQELLNKLRERDEAP